MAEDGAEGEGGDKSQEVPKDEPKDPLTELPFGVSVEQPGTLLMLLQVKCLSFNIDDGKLLSMLHDLRDSFVASK
jgi:hypothetical protein